MISKLNTTNIEIKSNHYLLRYLKEDDFTTFEDYLRMNGSHHSKEKRYQMFNQTLISQNTLGIFNQNQLIGAIEFFESYEEIPLDEQAHGLAIGYSIRLDFRNQGIMKQAIKSLIQYFKEIDFFYAYTSKENIASMQVLKDNGFINYKKDTYMHWLYINKNK